MDRGIATGGGILVYITPPSKKVCSVYSRPIYCIIYNIHIYIYIYIPNIYLSNQILDMPLLMESLFEIMKVFVVSGSRRTAVNYDVL